MSPNLSMSTGFGLFRNSNFLTSHERVVNSYISVFMYIHLLCFAEDSYQESKPGNEKRQVNGLQLLRDKTSYETVTFTD